MVSRRTTERIQGLMTAYQQSGIWAPHNPGQSGKASPADARRTNRSLIFSLLFPDVQLSRAELGRRTGLSRVAVSDVVNSMLSCHLLRENGRESNGGKGKRGTLLSVDPDTLHIISIDLSQPHLIQGEATNLLGEPVMHVEHALRAVNHVDFDTINEVITPLHAATQNVIGIGLAMPGVVDGNGLVKRSTLLGWRNVDVRTLIERRFSLPVTVNNDATAAMFTERLFGKGGPNMMFVRLRRGVGGAVLLGDVPVFGENHAGGEIGHISLDPQGPPCACGKRGCLERLVSATSLHARLQRSDERMRASILREAGTYLGTALSMPVGLLDLADVCVYGQSDIVNDTLLSAAQAQLDLLTGSSFHTRTIIRRCECEGEITLIGAAYHDAIASASGAPIRCHRAFRRQMNRRHARLLQGGNEIDGHTAAGLYLDAPRGVFGQLPQAAQTIRDACDATRGEHAGEAKFDQGIQRGELIVEHVERTMIRDLHLAIAAHGLVAGGLGQRAGERHVNAPVLGHASDDDAGRPGEDGRTDVGDLHVFLFIGERERTASRTDQHLDALGYADMGACLDHAEAWGQPARAHQSGAQFDAIRPLLMCDAGALHVLHRDFNRHCHLLRCVTYLVYHRTIPHEGTRTIPRPDTRKPWYKARHAEQRRASLFLINSVNI